MPSQNDTFDDFFYVFDDLLCAFDQVQVIFPLGVVQSGRDSDTPYSDVILGRRFGGGEH